MRSLRWLCIFVFFESQSQIVVDSTTVLNEVVVFGWSLDEYAAGSSIQPISLGSSGSLQNIGDESALFFKNYGNGGLSTISLRGTSASHTNVLWNGIPVNSPTLGQSDYSVFPAFLIDNVSVLKGSSSALFGSGSIGGTIIQDNSRTQKDSLVSIYAGVGSFGQFNSGLKIQYDLAPNLIAETRLFYSKIENDFRYLLRGEEIRQPNAVINRFGFSQRFNLQKDKSDFFAEVAFAENDREVQPTKTSASRDHLFTKNIRAVVNHTGYLERATFFSSLGYAGETTIYNITSETIAHTFSGQYAVDFSPFKWMSARVGVNAIQAWAKSDGYSKTRHAGQLHINSSFSILPVQQLRISINLRESIHENNAVFVPSFGIETTEGAFTLRGQLSKGYRIPTFNDRFWVPGGNPDLQPELSRNGELGIDYNQSNLSLGITGFMSNVKDWIQWISDNGIFRPQNIREVQTQGLEFKGVFDFTLGDVRAIWDVDYEYILSSDQSIEEDNQLPYVPKHSGFSCLAISRDMLSLKLRANYTGLRYTTLTNSEQSEIDEFLLYDVSISFSNLFKNMNTSLSLSANNLFDVDYENVKNTAMPGRNFTMELTTKF